MLWNTTALLGDPYTISYTTVVHDIVQTMDRLAAVLGTLFLRYAISILRLYLDKTRSQCADMLPVRTGCHGVWLFGKESAA